MSKRWLLGLLMALVGVLAMGAVSPAGASIIITVQNKVNKEPIKNAEVSVYKETYDKTTLKAPLISKEKVASGITGSNGVTSLVINEQYIPYTFLLEVVAEGFNTAKDHLSVRSSNMQIAKTYVLNPNAAAINLTNKSTAISAKAAINPAVNPSTISANDTFLTFYIYDLDSKLNKKDPKKSLSGVSITLVNYNYPAYEFKKCIQTNANGIAVFALHELLPEQYFVLFDGNLFLFANYLGGKIYDAGGPEGPRYGIKIVPHSNNEYSFWLKKK